MIRRDNVYKNTIQVKVWVSLKSIFLVWRAKMKKNTLVIKNIKISLHINTPLPACNIKTQLNSHVIAFKVYNTSLQRINVTGLQSYPEIKQVQALLTPLGVAPTHVGVLGVNIDSIFASRKLVQPVYFNMVKLYHHAQNIVPRHKYIVYYNPEEGAKCLLLPKMTRQNNKPPPTRKINLKKLFSQKNNKPPQITLFHTGSVTVMGIKSLAQLDQVDQLVSKLYRDEFQLKQTSS